MEILICPPKVPLHLLHSQVHLLLVVLSKYAKSVLGHAPKSIGLIHECHAHELFVRPWLGSLCLIYFPIEKVTHGLSSVHIPIPRPSHQ